MRHLSEELIDEVDEHLDRAIRRVRTGKVSKASVGLAFDVVEDPDDGIVVTFTRKGAEARRGSFQPAGEGQERLPLDDTTVTLLAGGLTATTSGSLLARAAEVMRGER